jgi:hypothetical protein
MKPFSQTRPGLRQGARANLAEFGEWRRRLALPASARLIGMACRKQPYHAPSHDFMTQGSWMGPPEFR